jgi:hypothetical protein
MVATNCQELSENFRDLIFVNISKVLEEAPVRRPYEAETFRQDARIRENSGSHRARKRESFEQSETFEPVAHGY